MDSIVIKVSELYQMAALLKKDKMDYVELSIIEADSEVERNFVSFSAVSSKLPEEVVDYEAIDEVPKEECEFNLFS